MFEGHCNTTVFKVYIEKILVPPLSKGMVVIINNANFHRSKKTKYFIEKVGCQLIYLPLYSPDLNHIEHYWHKLKTTIRKMARNTKVILAETMTVTLKNSSQC